MDLLDLMSPSLAENLALDEALLLAAECGDGAEVLRFWEWPTPAVVLDTSGRLAELERRHAEFEKDPSIAIPWDEVRRRLWKEE